MSADRRREIGCLIRGPNRPAPKPAKPLLGPVERCPNIRLDNRAVKPTLDAAVGPWRSGGPPDPGVSEDALVVLISIRSRGIYQ